MDIGWNRFIKTGMADWVKLIFYFGVVCTQKGIVNVCYRLKELLLTRASGYDTQDLDSDQRGIITASKNAVSIS